VNVRGIRDPLDPETAVPLRLSSLCLSFATLCVFLSGNFNFDSTLIDVAGSL
jgi:hypothetical protein